ncbi:glycosyltransferase involved in cell wall biosynthesis [Phyllobacterium sp. 1468]|uniref:glycosyltransferase family 2 protein n=1 Tax=Phyllobacterium sp. 1468 TaxID=2817759 RepID=UPI0028662882|nr:glycosyltransferase involved in cell wall biosynthesis [Phyllobacterium sp. 1468]
MDMELHHTARHSFKMARALSTKAPSESEKPVQGSFIVCTRNRAAALAACIRSIEAACRSHAAFTSELIVVDNGSTDSTPEYVMGVAAASDVPITLLAEARPGLAAARNAGLQHARGSIVIFIDDDCEVHRDYLRDLERHYATGERLVIRGGRVELGNPNDLPFTIKRSPTRARLTRDVHPGGFVVGCNMTMHRDVAARIGHFDELLGAGAPLRAAEDTDYLIRAFQLNFPVEYVPDMTVFHHHGRSSRQDVERLHRSYSLGNGGLYVKHIRCAPWLLRHFFWSVRSACRELFGGPRFDPELHLSHWPIVFMNLLGAVAFMGLLLTKRRRRREVRQDKEAALELR